MANEVTSLLKRIFNKPNSVADGCYTATLSDTIDLIRPGRIQPRLLTGTVKYTDMNDNIGTITFALNEVSLFRVKRVWSTGTTANMGIVVIC